MKCALLPGLLALSAVVCYGRIDDADKGELIGENRVPKTAVFSNVCVECESLMKRVVAVAQDPTKLAELKILLSALCHETSYAEECRVIVSKFDFFIRELLPYMKDAHRVCVDLHMCSDKNVELFHRVGMLYAKKYINKVDGASDLICEECQFAAHEINTNVVENHDVQADIRRFLSENVCRHIVQYQGACDLLLDDFLPQLFTEMGNMLRKPHEFCEHIKLCKTTGVSIRSTQKALHEEKLEPGAFKEIMTKLSSTPLRNNPNLAAASCIECRIAIETLLLQLGNNDTTKSLADDLRNFACPILPKTWYDGCEDFLNLYAQTVVKMTVAQVTAESICEGTHACAKKQFQQAVGLTKQSGISCAACEEVSKLLQIELESRHMRQRLIHEAKHFVCDRLPSGLKFPCYNLTRSWVPLVLTRLLQRLQKNELCHIMHVCS